VIEIEQLQGNQTLITVSDDGGGIDLDTIRQQAKHLGLMLIQSPPPRMKTSNSF